MFQSRVCAVLRSRVSLSWRRKTRDAPPWQQTTAITCTPARAAFSDGSPPLCAIPPAPGTTLILSQNYPVRRTTGRESGGKNSAQSAARDVVSLVYLCVIMIVWYRKQKTTSPNFVKFCPLTDIPANISNILENLQNFIPECLTILFLAAATYFVPIRYKLHFIRIWRVCLLEMNLAGGFELKKFLHNQSVPCAQCLTSSALQICPMNSALESTGKTVIERNGFCLVSKMIFV